jgi:hypothetical protein
MSKMFRVITFQVLGVSNNIAGNVPGLAEGVELELCLPGTAAD